MSEYIKYFQNGGYKEIWDENWKEKLFAGLSSRITIIFWLVQSQQNNYYLHTNMHEHDRIFFSIILLQQNIIIINIITNIYTYIISV